MSKSKLAPGFLVILPLLASCQTGPAFVSPHLALGAVAGQPAPAVEVQAAVQPAGATGQVTIGLAQLLPRARQLLYTLSDVDQVVVSLQPTSVGSTAVTKTLQKADLQAGQASVTFDDVAPGPQGFIVVVKDAAGTTIGSASGTVTVAAGQTTAVTARFSLTPVYATPAPTSGGGTSTPTTGSFQATLDISDSPVLQPLTLKAHIQVPGHWFTTALSRDGQTYWGANNTDDGLGGDLVKFDRSGQVLAVPTGLHQKTGSLVLGGDGNPIVLSEEGPIVPSAPGSLGPGFQGAVGPGDEGLVHLAADGSVSSFKSLSGGAWDYLLTMASDGALWFRADLEAQSQAGPLLLSHSQAGLSRVDAQGALTTFDTGFRSVRLVPGTNGAMYAIEQGPQERVAKRGADGSLLWTVTPGQEIYTVGADERDHLWVFYRKDRTVTANQLSEYTPDGQLIATHDLPASLGLPFFENGSLAGLPIICSPDGTKYLGLAGGSFNLVKLDADGSVAGLFYAPEFVDSVRIPGFDVSTNGELVVSSSTSGEYVYQLP